jgi:hypothetical protein
MMTVAVALACLYIGWILGRVSVAKKAASELRVRQCELEALIDLTDALAARADESSG